MDDHPLRVGDPAGGPVVAVIVPYFQREPGILRRSIDSVFSQVDAPSCEVIIVDDGSPVPAADEMRHLPAPQREKIRVIEQPNGGPGKARNTGLDAVRDGTRYIAFLDSDDVWFGHHLQDAVFALEQGYDFYFSDLYHIGQEISAFKRARTIDPSQHPRIDGRHHLHAYQGDMVNQIITANLIGTPTVVYAYERFRSVRFRVEFLNAGEDYLFWLEIASRKPKIAFSSRCGTRCGTGVNVYSGAGWGTEQHLLRVHNEMRYRKLTSRLFPVTPAQVRVLDAKIEALRVAFVGDFLHRLARMQRIPLGLILRHAAMDPMTFVKLLPISIGILLRSKS